MLSSTDGLVLPLYTLPRLPAPPPALVVAYLITLYKTTRLAHGPLFSIPVRALIRTSITRPCVYRVNGFGEKDRADVDVRRMYAFCLERVGLSRRTAHVKSPWYRKPRSTLVSVHLSAYAKKQDPIAVALVGTVTVGYTPILHLAITFPFLTRQNTRSCPPRWQL